MTTPAKPSPPGWPKPGVKRIDRVGNYVETVAVNDDGELVWGLYTSVSGSVRTETGKRFESWTEVDNVLYVKETA